MANTTNLNLVKPAGTDYALVSVINGNMDIIDSKVGAVPSNASVQGQIDTLNNQMTNLIKISKQTFSNVEIGSDGNISFSFSGHSVIAIVHDKAYYACAPWKDAYNYWHGKLTSASNDSHPSSGTVSGTIYYVD